MLTFICGQIGSGKTTLNDVLTARLARENPEMPVIAARKEGFRNTKLPGRTKTFYYSGDALDYIEDKALANFILSISELQDVAGSRTDRYDPRMFDLIFRGRHIGCNLICDSQRPARVTTDYPSQATDIYVFGLKLQHDLKYIEEYLDDPARGEVIRAFPPHVFMHLQTGRICKLKI